MAKYDSPYVEDPYPKDKDIPRFASDSIAYFTRDSYTVKENYKDEGKGSSYGEKSPSEMPKFELVSQNSKNSEEGEKTKEEKESDKDDKKKDSKDKKGNKDGEKKKDETTAINSIFKNASYDSLSKWDFERSRIYDAYYVYNFVGGVKKGNNYQKYQA